MADSMPICDVLSEAMEYLSKLGTNIRIRSENLREKRIRKDKLKNTHAIHKAVDKVLLICELSKKSIENVETGVRNLLLQMEKSGSSHDSPPRTRGTTESEVNFEYFTYELRRLKIRDKISLGHYTSVKVVSTSMTMAMLEKYPVFHNCKLYRMRARRNRESMASAVEHFSAELENFGQPSSMTVENLDISHITLDDSNTTEPMQVCELSENNEGGSASVIQSEKDSQEDSHNSIQNKENKIEEADLPARDRHKRDENDSDSDTKHKKKMKPKKTKFKHIKVIDDSSNSSRENDTSDKIENNEDISLSKKASETNSDMEKKIKDSDEPMKSENVILDKDSNTIEESSETKENTTKLDNTNVDNDAPPVKPMIKCVSLSKLLKPENVKSLNIEKSESPKDKKKDKHERRKERNSKSEGKFKRLKRLDTSDEDEDLEEYAYWARKRKEVKKFKPKKFNINITRLPKVTTALLENFNLRRITHCGTVLCEIISKSDNEKNEDECNNLEPRSKKRKTYKNEENMDLDKVKSALLYDSDSDDIVSRDNIKDKEKTNIFPDSDVEINNKKQDKTVNKPPSDLREGDADESELIREIQSKNDEEGSHSDNNISQSISNNMLNNEKNSETHNEGADNISKTTLIEECEVASNKPKNCADSESIKSNLDRQSENMDETDSTEIDSKKLKKAQNLQSSLDDECDEEEISKNSKDDSESSVSNINNEKLENNENPPSCQDNKSSTEVKDDKQTEKHKKEKSHHSHKSNKHLKKLYRKKLKKHTQEDSDESEKLGHEESDCVLKNVENDKVKCSLLNESDSESHSKEEQENSSKVKSSLLADSDESQNLDKENEGGKVKETDLIMQNEKEQEKIKNSFLEESESESQGAEKELSDVLKNFLNGSDCDEGQDKTSDQEKRSDLLVLDELRAERDSDKLENTKKDLNKSDREPKNPEKSENDDKDPNKEKDLQEDVQERKKKRSRSHSNVETEIVKSSLLKDSSDDHSKTPKKRKNSSGDSPPQSKRKHIMESMYAKKMLLTYSSSSDTEDEQLKNVLKEIKTSLLKGISSDEEDKTKDGKSSSELDQNVEGSEAKQDSSDSEESSDTDIIKSKTVKQEKSDSDSKDTSSKGRTCGSISDVSSKKKVRI